MKHKRPPLSTFFINAVIDLLLIGLGFGFYYHFMVRPFGPIDLHPFVITLFNGNKPLAILVIAGLPFVFGMFGLLKSIVQVLLGKDRRQAAAS